MRLTVVGCSGSVPGPGSSASCYLVEADGFHLVMDLGNGAWGQLQRYVKPQDVDAVLISHLHADHCLDLCPMYVHLRWGVTPMGGRVPVHGPDRTGDHMAAAYDVPREEMETVLEYFPVRPGTFTVGPFTVTAARVAHPVPAFAFRLEHDGRILMFTGDSGPCMALEELAVGADLLLAEAAFITGPDNPPDLHLTGAEAGRLGAVAGAGRLVLTHIPPWIPEGVAAQEAALHFEGPIDVAVPGLILEV
jgi:ribonuclease BN (tRNA processing enzyme)